MFDFMSLSLSQPARQQLSAVYRHAVNDFAAVASRSSFLQLLRNNAFDEERGIYVPFSSTVKLAGKLPFLSQHLASIDVTLPPEVCFFTNTLLIPEGFFEPNFDSKDAPPPLMRLVDSGFLVVTLEFDSEAGEQFEEMLSWTSRAGGIFARSRFADVDRELCRFKDYIGYNITYSGGRSLHFHFVFSTRHVQAAPFDDDVHSRHGGYETIAALMNNVHDRYWDHVREVMQDKLRPTLATDDKMRSAVQWRRTPWAVRELDKSIPALGLTTGTKVPQLLIHENIRARAPRGAKGYLVPAEVCLAYPRPAKVRQRSITSAAPTETSSEEIDLIRDMCRITWGSDFPKPIAVGQQAGQVVIRFKNHEADQNPSTVCIGQNRKLLLCGVHSLDGDFFLPDDMTAEELVRHASLRCGLVAEPKLVDAPAGVLPTMFMPVEPVRSFAELKARSGSGVDPITESVFRPVRGLLQDTDDRQARIAKLREVSPSTVGSMIELQTNYVFKAPEGFSKSTAHFDHLTIEALDDALRRNGARHHFIAFACRSEKQAQEKAAEYRKRTGKKAVAVVSLQRIYERICDEAGVNPISRSGFRHGTVSHFLETIQLKQAEVARRLEEHRRSIWVEAGRNLFDGSATTVFMTHALTRLWPQTWKTRIWHHPGYDPSISDDEAEHLRSEFNLSRVVWDELEIDDFVHLLTGSLYDLLARQQKKHSGWRDMPRAERLDVFGALKIGKAIPDPDMTFDTFDSLIRLNLSTLDAVPVDFDAIPFGYDNKPNGLYNGRHGNEWYIAAQSWPSSSTKWSFLTTETLTTKVVEAVFAQNEKQLFTFTLPDVPGIHPIKIPVVLDPRAKKKDVIALAMEIIDSTPDAYVISDGVGEADRVLTFQKAKGFNGLEDKDVYIIMTNLAPAKYEELNVLGQWLGIPDVIQMYYQDQINQAVGRNTGFRQSTTRTTRTVVIAAKRFYEGVLAKFPMNGRVQLYRTDTREW